VPLLTIGLPTSATAAILLAAFQQYGLRPGPLLFEHEPALVWGVIASLFIGNTLLLALNLPLVGLWIRLLTVPRPLLYGAILLLASVGAFSVHGSTLDLVMLGVMGLLGYALRTGDYPVAPVIIGLLLGPMAEQHFARAVSVASDSVVQAFARPVAGSLLAVAVFVVAGPAVAGTLQRARARSRNS